MALSPFAPCAPQDEAIRICNTCETEPNKLIHVALVRNAVTLPTATPAGYTAALLAAEAACNAIIIRNVSGTYDGGEPQMGPGGGRQSERLLGYNHGLDYIDYDGLHNIKFYDRLAKRTSGYYFVFFTETMAWEVKTTISLIPKPAISDDNSTQIQVPIRVTWRKDVHPEPTKADTFALDECQALFDVEDAEFLNVSGSTAGVFGGLEVEATVNSLVVVELNVPIGVKVDVAQGVGEVQLPLGLTLAIKPNGGGIRIAGTPTVAGRSEVVLHLQNACGVAAQIETVFVVA